MARSREEHEKASSDAGGIPHLPKPTLQQLEAAADDIEHFLSTFERIAAQQRWPKEILATQLARLLTRKAMAGYTSMSNKKCWHHLIHHAGWLLPIL